MGGRGSLESLTTHSLSELEDLARKELTAKITTVRRRVFLSFRHTDKNAVDLLRAQAKSETSTLDFIDMSLQTPFNSENAEYIRTGIRSRIQASSATLVFVSDTTFESDWVNWEVEETLNQGKKVIVIDSRTYDGSRIPNSIEENKSKIKFVRLNQAEIMQALGEINE